MAGEQLHVLGALSQRREGDLDHLEPVVEVLPEAALLDGDGEIAVGGGDDAHVHGERFAAADALEAALLEYAQQLHLKVEWHFADPSRKRPLCASSERHPGAGRRR
jgi:hypothetical protein